MGRPIWPGAVDNITKGETTREDIVSLFGNPSTATLDENGNVRYMYICSKAKTYLYSFSMPSTQTQFLTIMFDENEIVTKYLFQDFSQF